MANTTTTPKHTDPATKAKEKKNEEEVKDKTSGKTVKTQKKIAFFKTINGSKRLTFRAIFLVLGSRRCAVLPAYSQACSRRCSRMISSVW